MKLTRHLLVCFLLTGCSTESISEYNISESIFGKWQMQSYADGREIPFDVTIELKPETDSLGRHIINGKSPLNFYFSTFEVDVSSKAIKIFDIQITKVEGASNTVLFENNYLETLSKVDHYEVSKSSGVLKLLLPDSTNQYIIYKLAP